MSQFNSGIFSCFSDPRLCILTFCCPCYTLGRNAEAGLDEDCLLIGLLCAAGINTSAVVRWRLREKDNLKGSMITDVLLHGFLPCCSLIQEAKHLGWALPKEISGHDDMSRT